MKKIIPIKINKLWGYELWLHSPLKSNQSFCEDGTKIKNGPLVKIINTHEPLSIQVHPDDKLAAILENASNGKSECWYILESSNDTEYILGINTLDKKKIRNSLKNNSFENLLFKTKVKPNDYIDIPAGMVHGVGKNTKLLEIQQPSDITYRFYDYNRIQDGRARELHIEKSLQAIKMFNKKITPNCKSYNFMEYKVTYHKDSITLNKEAIVIDINNEVGYLFDNNEKIPFDYYCIIKLL